MGAPPIQYCRTEDGVSLAYWTLGDRANPVLINVPWGIGHLTAEWEIEQFRAWYQRLARRFFLVAYDARGSGLSQREVTDLSVASMAGDIATVADHLKLDRYILLTAGRGSLWTIVHAVDRPEAVSHLVLWTPIVSGAAFGATPQHQALGPAAQVDFTFWRRASGAILSGHQDADLANQVAGSLEQATTVDHYQALDLITRTGDVTTELPKVRAEALVFGVRDLGYAPLAFAQEAAAAIPDAQLIVAAESVAGPQLGNAAAYAQAIEAHVFKESGEQDVPSAPSTSQMATVEEDDSHGRPTPLSNDSESSTRFTNPHRLTPREIEVLREVASGARNSEIAGTLTISPATVTRHISNILNKTELSNRTELAHYAAVHNLIRVDAPKG